MLKWHKVRLSRGFLLCLALFLYFDQEGLLLWVTLAAMIHEMGHYVTIAALGGKVNHITFSCVGVEMALSARYPLVGLKLALVTMAGPMANFLMALMIWVLGQPLGDEGTLFWALNVGLGVFNLLPVAQLDGGRLLWQYAMAGCRSALAEQFLWVLSIYLSGLLVIGGILLWVFGGGTATLLMTALWLFATALGIRVGRRKKSTKKSKKFLAFYHLVW